MSTNSLTTRPTDLDDPALAEADAAAVLECLTSGGPLDPAVADRARARAERVTDDIRRTRGVIDDAAFQALLDDEVAEVGSSVQLDLSDVPVELRPALLVQIWELIREQAARTTQKLVVVG